MSLTATFWPCKTFKPGGSRLETKIHLPRYRRFASRKRASAQGAA